MSSKEKTSANSSRELVLMQGQGNAPRARSLSNISLSAATILETPADGGLAIKEHPVPPVYQEQSVLNHRAILDGGHIKCFQ